MNILGRILMGCVAAGALSCSASAADMAVKAMPQATPVAYTDWTGLYVGVVVGGAFSKVGNDPYVAPTGLAGTSTNNTSFLAGGTIGYNYQMANRIVLGVEGDISFAEGRRATVFAEDDSTSNFWDTRQRWVGTARARIGYAMDGGLLVYVTGGAIFGDGNVFWTYENGDAPSVTLKLPNVGGVAGAGFEYAFAPQWSAKLEYLHGFFGNKSNNVQTFSDDVTPIGGYQKLSMDIVRFGVNYKLGWGHP
jgi:outer membrane immunogenic protein